MIALIAFSKTMAEHAKSISLMTSTPIWEKQAKEYAEMASRLCPEDFEVLLKTNSKIAHETFRRFQMMVNGEAELMPALSAYTGAVFRNIDTAGLSEADWHFAQEHIRISSCLYGMLRPLDHIAPYRLEGNICLDRHCIGDASTDLFHAWRPLLTPALIEDVRNHGGILVNLASEEMKLFFDWKEIEKNALIVKPDFYIRKAGKLKSVTMYAKMCRGRMIRHIIDQRAEKVSDLKSFTWEGFRYDEERSDGTRLVFIRDEDSHI